MENAWRKAFTALYREQSRLNEAGKRMLHIEHTYGVEYTQAVDVLVQRILELEGILEPLVEGAYFRRAEGRSAYLCNYCNSFWWANEEENHTENCPVTKGKGLLK